MDARTTDLNLLLVFDAMFRHRQVTKAGESLGLSQPAMSAAINRLRSLMDDPLFVRSGSSMVPTPRAEALGPEVRQIVQAIENAILKPKTFDPSLSERSFSLLAPDIAEVNFLPNLLSALASSAPLISVKTFGLPREVAAEALESGAVDLAIGYFPDLRRGGFFQQRLFKSKHVCICRKDHPGIGDALTIEQFCMLEHAVVTPGGREHVFEQFLKAKGIQRRVKVHISHFMSLLPIIERSDLIATIPRDLAELLVLHGDLRYVETPMESPVIDVLLIWHQRFQKDPAHAWLRQTIFNLFGR
ncbi:LysR family transcriptional regulator [Azoarcus sp. L1K30]|uniref:LysR family transcriptional regulator n=1 Tax=Azoarcus sp. L1K30 TaxID=2820277 RepID=UPI001B82E2D2|nr:LysR family transcriptional regulator [Azoarcus sp. L1K30]MBR0567887.1 LysR family transcriptional regulator [Azoarcus sp. L1K30]